MAMPGNIYLLTDTFKAAGAIVANRFVSGGPDAGASQTGAAATSNGVAREAANTGDYFPVDISGIVTVEGGGAITENALVEADASGRAVTHAAGVVLGRALSACAGSGKFFRCLLLPTTS